LPTAAAAVKEACDAVLWNIENSETIGFKRTLLRIKGGHLEFAERCFAQGEFLRTGEPLDVAITGPGFFELELPDGTKGYTRDGSFELRWTGLLVSKAKGSPLAGKKPLPFRAGTIEIASDGTVKQVSSSGSALSRIRVVVFPNPAGLTWNGEGMFLETAASGAAEVLELDRNSTSARGLTQGFLELSNVHVAEEMVSLMRLLEWKKSVRLLIPDARPSPSKQEAP